MCRFTALLVLFSLGCGGSVSPTQPTLSPPASMPQEFSLSGSVADTAFRSLADARVEVITGSKAGTFTITDVNGRFLMPGTFTDTVTIRATSDGYQPETKTVPPNFPPNGFVPPLPPGEVRRWDVYLSLQPDGPSANLAGAYTLTLSADTACTNLPEEARTRTYTATIVPGSRPTTFIGRLSDARIVPVPIWPPYFEIGVAGDFANLALSFVEQLRDGTYLAIEGGTAALLGPSGITAPFNAHFVRCRNQPAMAPGEYWWCGADVQGDECASSNNQLTLVRR
jgi:Carboxypeptidase regulatory-like domain